MNIAAHPKHKSYKDSGIDWIGEVPTSWSVEPGRQCLYESKEKNIGIKESTVLSLSYGNVIVKDEDKLTGLVPESFETYQVVQPGDIIIRGTDLQNDMASLRTGLVRDTGIITSAYINLRPKAEIDPKFMHYLLHSYDVKKVFYALGSGLRQNLSYEDFKYLRLPIPSAEEQRAIAAFLDGKSAVIDEAVRIKEAQIKLLAERRHILIQQAVTRGLNPDAPMKDSGIDWIPAPPNHWTFKKLKYVTKIVKRIIGFEEPDVLSITQQGVKVKDIESGEGQLASDYSNYQVVDVGDFAMNHMDLITGYVDISKHHGVTSPDYRVFKNVAFDVDDAYLLLLFQLGYKNRIFFKYGQGVHTQGRWRLPADAFNNFYVPIPPLTEQRSIVEYVTELSSKVDKGISLKLHQIAALKEYKTSLINAAVTGKIKVI